MAESTGVTRTLTDRRVAVLMLRGAQSRNALGFATWEQLENELTGAESDDIVRAVVLTGDAGCFSSGGDLRSTSGRGRGVRAISARLELAQRVLCHINAAVKPIIAAVEGPAVGIGWSLAQSCDLVVAASDAYFWAPFLRRGLIPDGGLSWMLSRLVGRQRASAILLLAERLPAPDAHELGLVHHITQPGGALESAIAVATELAQRPPEATALARELLRRGERMSFSDFLDEELLTSALHMRSPESSEGRNAFVGSRLAQFDDPQPFDDG
jgi:enoyl-CoA hydratase/carnithine racemase